MREYWNFSTDCMPTEPENIPCDAADLFISREDAVVAAVSFCEADGIEFGEEMIAEVDGPRD